MHITETVHAFLIMRHPKLTQLVQILADILISESKSASTIRLCVRIITKTANAIGTEARICRTKLAQVSKVITCAKETNFNDMFMHAISTNPTIIAVIYRIWASAS